jgi:hypothetical protein
MKAYVIGDLISLVNQRLRSMSRQRWIKPLAEFQSRNGLFQGAVREAKKPAKLGIACSAASFGDVQGCRRYCSPKL